MRRLRILVWHTHGAYLHYLTQAPHDFYVLSKPGRPPGYAGRSGHIPWGDNVHDMPTGEARHQPLDLIVFQDDPQYLEDQHRYLSAAQRRLPRIYIEHDPPRAHAVDTPHLVREPDVLVVHCTHFNRLMWDNGNVPTHVIEHGVIAPRATYSGELDKGLVIINHIARRGRHSCATNCRYICSRTREPRRPSSFGASASASSSFSRSRSFTGHVDQP
jgi:hypothetical protein